MLGILLGALKIIGLIILIIVAILLLLLCMVLFIPVHYSVDARYDSAAYYRVWVRWFFNLVCYRYKSDSGNAESDFRVLWLHPKSGDGKDDDSKYSVQNTKLDEKTVDTTIEKTQEDTAGQTEMPALMQDEELTGQKPQSKSAQSKKRNRKREKNKQDKSVSGGLLDTVKSVLDYPDKDLILDKLLKLAVGLFKVCMPSKFDCSIVLGIGNPADTALLTGWIHLFAGMTGANIHVQADFDKPILAAKCDIKGRLLIGGIIWVFIRFIISKPIWRIVLAYIRKR